jgi:hypothetical protein
LPEQDAADDDKNGSPNEIDDNRVIELVGHGFSRHPVKIAVEGSLSQRVYADRQYDYSKRGDQDWARHVSFLLFLPNDERVHHYQRGRASITGLML